MGDKSRGACRIRGEVIHFSASVAVSGTRSGVPPVVWCFQMSGLVDTELCIEVEQHLIRAQAQAVQLRILALLLLLKPLALVSCRLSTLSASALCRGEGGGE